MRSRSKWGGQAVLAGLVLMPAIGCGAGPVPPSVQVVPPEETPTPTPSPAPPPGPNLADAQAFVDRVEGELLRLFVASERANWVKQTYITDDTSAIAAEAQEALMAFTGEVAAEATRFDALALTPDLRRKLQLLKLSLSLPAPRDPSQRAELARIATELDSIYGMGKVCSEKLATAWKKITKAKQRPKDDCLALGELEAVLAKSRDYDDLLAAWVGWRQISVPMRKPFERYVELANLGARDLGFADLGELWKSRYEVSPEAFEQEVDRLWGQVKPLYDDLHCYTRARLRSLYGERVPVDGPIPAHLLGNMWAQDWGNLRNLLLPDPKAGTVNLERVLAEKKIDEREMVRYGERFFVSLGLDALPETFWQRSMFTKPRDREVVCHASAWDIDYVGDLRIKMCIERNDDNFSVIHHELGHNYYQYNYRQQSALYRESANDGFHEGLGDTIALSVTPSYLVKIGLLRSAPDGALNTLMERALDKVAFLPFGVLIDKWRWDVFSGKATGQDFNNHWWELRTRYQGVAAPVDRSEADFDPGAKYHIPANVPYTRYFLATILQFQFHRALCRIIGHEGPLHTCSIYDNKEAGARLRQMMEMGLSRPWPEALKALTGEEEMDASAILAYFEPLHVWLKEQNKGLKCGW